MSLPLAILPKLDRVRMKIPDHPDPVGRPYRGVVCIIDGDPGIRNSLRVLLETLPVRVEAFSSAEEFLERPKGYPISLLITELDLPGMSGIELKRALDRCDSPIPVIGLSNTSSRQERRLTSRLRFLAVLEKPFVHRPILDRVQEALHLS